MAVRLLPVVAAIAVLYGCSQAGAPVTTVREPATPETAPPMPDPAAPTVAPASASASAGISGEELAAQSEADCRLVIHVAQADMSRQKANAFSELLADMVRSMQNGSWTAGSLRNAALDHLGVARYPECKQ
jgi:hypothetical protein